MKTFSYLFVFLLSLFYKKSCSIFLPLFDFGAEINAVKVKIKGSRCQCEQACKPVQTMPVGCLCPPIQPPCYSPTSTNFNSQNTIYTTGQQASSSNEQYFQRLYYPINNPPMIQPIYNYEMFQAVQNTPPPPPSSPPVYIPLTSAPLPVDAYNEPVNLQGPKEMNYAIQFKQRKESQSLPDIYYQSSSSFNQSPKEITPVIDNQEVIEAPETDEMYSTNLKRGEGKLGISHSGYDYSQSPPSPVVLDFLEEPRKEENSIKANDSNFEDFTTEVDNFYKTSTIANPVEYEPLRGSRSSEKIQHEEKTPKSFVDKSISVKPRKTKSFEDLDYKCNKHDLKLLMEAKMTKSASISKQMIYSACTKAYPDRSINVICSKHSFSYVVVTSPIFCEHRKNLLTCFVFFTP